MFASSLNRRRRGAARRSAAPAAFEPLEARQMLAASATLLNGLLRIDGSNGADSIVVAKVRAPIRAGTSPGGQNIVWTEQYRVRVTDFAGIVRKDARGVPVDRSFDVSAVTRVDVYGAGGNDRVDTTAVSLPTAVYGGAGSDTVTTGAGSDSVWGEAGDDHVSLGDGDDYFNGAFGNDTAFGGAGLDYLRGLDGNDSLSGGSGNDLLDGGAGDDRLSGNSGHDDICGRAGADTISGGDGADVIRGEAGNDHLDGNQGNDTLYGGSGDDKLFGGAGTDQLFGEFGDDWMEAGSASERADGGEGKDWNAHVWAINGDWTTDVNQTGAGSCVLLSALASASRHLNLADHITYMGGHNYKVKFYNANKNPVHTTVSFDGTMVRDGEGNLVDPASQSEGEFWTILFQRAYLKRFFNIDPMDGDAVAAFDGEPNGDNAIRALTGRNTWTNYKTIFGFNRDALRGELERGETVNAGGTGHRYAVIDLIEDSAAAGGYTVKLYNPWGVDKVHDDDIEFTGGGANDGYIYVSWTEFSERFENYTTSW